MENLNQISNLNKNRLTFYSLEMSKEIYKFEHEFLAVGEDGFSDTHFRLLEKYLEKQKKSYLFETSYRKGKQGIKFCQYVGVITVKDLTIYVLPKADKDAKEETENEKLWQGRLTFMLLQVYKLNVQTTSPANLQWRPNVLLNIFLKKFLDEVAVLLNRGLIKTYRKTDGNRTALKGKLLFNKQIAYNCVHQERFYVRYTTYDYNHILNRIIRQALLAICDITNSSDIKGRATSTLFNFPELDEIAVTPELFSRLIFDRKSEDYRNVIKLAEMILLNYSPDLHHGSNHVWTLMFDMNKLWEEFVFVTLRRKLTSYNVSEQDSRLFWKRTDPNRSKTKTVRADIVISNEEGCFVLDTKWKTPYDKDSNGKLDISDSDLHQMYVYSHIYKKDKGKTSVEKEVKRVALLYPRCRDNDEDIIGEFVDNGAGCAGCDMIFLPGVSENPESEQDVVQSNDDCQKNWQEQIFNRVKNWIEVNK